MPDALRRRKCACGHMTRCEPIGMRWLHFRVVWPRLYGRKIRVEEWMVHCPSCRMRGRNCTRLRAQRQHEPMIKMGVTR